MNNLSAVNCFSYLPGSEILYVINSVDLNLGHLVLDSLGISWFDSGSIFTEEMGTISHRRQIRKKL